MLNRYSQAEARASWRKGSSLLEFALCLPLLFILIANVVNFGGFFFAWVTVENAARTGAQYMARAGLGLGDPAPSPSASPNLTNIVTNDISSLPNNPSLALQYCTRTPSNAPDSGTQPVCTVLAGTFGARTPTNPAPDGRTEAVGYVMAWTDVSYTYLPFISFNFQFPALGFGPIWPGSSAPVVIHRQVVMRILQ